jgi:hypothetical protein
MVEHKSVLRQHTYAQGDESWVEYVPFTVEERFDTDKQKTMKEEVFDRIKKWNWKDKDGNDLPNPEDEPEILNTRTTYEYACLINVIYSMPDENDVKN